MKESNIYSIILAAGKGSRMNSNKPKVLHHIGGKSMINHVLDTAKQVSSQQFVVIGNQAEAVKQHILQEKDNIKTVSFAQQKKQLGTGDAVLTALKEISAKKQLQKNQLILILYGDVPLVSVPILQRLCQLCNNHEIVLLSTKIDNPTGYGRIIRDGTESVIQIVEESDATSEQKKIKEINSGIMVARSQNLVQWLQEIDNKNNQQEYYLPDIVSNYVKGGFSVGAVCIDNSNEVSGVNSQLQRAQQERYYQQKIITQLVEQGLGVADTQRIDVRGNLTIGTDVFLDINIIISGDVTIGDNVIVGPGCIIRNCTIGSNCIIKPYSNLENSSIGKNCIIGPYARIRPETILKDNVHIGNFVETKKSIINQGTKINHLTYIGDSIIGKNVNIGAGAITCNFDGKNKNITKIGDDAFIGSGTQLIAPVKIGERSTIGAGSVISDDVKDDSLCFTRPPEIHKQSWKRKI